MSTKEFVKEFGLDPDGKFGLSREDAIHIWNNAFGLKSMAKLYELISGLNQWALACKNGEYIWFSEGCKCEILRTKGGGWQKGKLRFRLEFIPDNPEAFIEPAYSVEKPPSPLEDLRSDLNINK